MKKGIFTLTGPLEGKTMVILEKYSFVDGKMEVSQTDALLMRTILCNHYACDLNFVEVKSEEVAGSEAEGSLAVASTKHGQTEGDKHNEQALNSALANAERVQAKPEGK